jgi:hypothetical protein
MCVGKHLHSSTYTPEVGVVHVGTLLLGMICMYMQVLRYDLHVYAGVHAQE